MVFQAVVSKLSFLKLLGFGAVLWLTFLLPRQVAFILHFPKQVIYVVLGSATFEFLSQWLMSVSQIRFYLKTASCTQPPYMFSHFTGETESPPRCFIISLPGSFPHGKREQILSLLFSPITVQLTFHPVDRSHV